MPVTAPPRNATLSAGVESAACGFGGAHVGANRDDHADEAGRAREDRADQEADRRLPAERRGEEDDDRQDDRDDADRAVLPLEEGHRAFLDGRGDLSHALVARRLPQHPEGEGDAVEHGEGAADQSGHNRCLCRHPSLSGRQKYRPRGPTALPTPARRKSYPARLARDSAVCRCIACRL